MAATCTLESFVDYILELMPEDLFIGLPRAMKLRRMIVSSLKQRNIHSVEELGDTFIGNTVAVSQVRASVIEALPSDKFGREFLETLLFFCSFARAASNISAWEALQKQRALDALAERNAAGRRAQQEEQIERERKAAEDSMVRREAQKTEAERQAEDWKEKIIEHAAEVGGGSSGRFGFLARGRDGNGPTGSLVELTAETRSSSMASSISSSRLQRSTRRRSASLLQRLVRGNNNEVRS